MNFKNIFRIFRRKAPPSGSQITCGMGGLALEVSSLIHVGDYRYTFEPDSNCAPFESLTAADIEDWDEGDHHPPKDHVFQWGVGAMLAMTPIAFWLGLPVLTTSVVVGWSVMTVMAILIRFHRKESNEPGAHP